MGWISDAKKKLKKAAKKVKKAVNKVADKIADKIEEAGAKAREASENFADFLENNIPIIGGALATGARWLGRVAESLFDLASAFVKGLGSIIAGILSGVLLILSGDFKNAFLDIFHGILGAILIFAGSGISLIQTVFGQEGTKRRLNETEITLLGQVFCESVDLEQIKIVKGASGIFSFNDQPFTMGNIIYMKNTIALDWKKDLVHETTHVWQYQDSGSRYSSEALAAQFYYDFQSLSAYDWWDPEVNDDKFVWSAWNRESQAQFIEDLWLDGELSTKGGAIVLDSDGIYFEANGTTKIGRLIFAPTATPKNADAITRWTATLPPGDTTIDYSDTALGAKEILHHNCVRFTTVSLIRTP
jgi:hypothetical protein